MQFSDQLATFMTELKLTLSQLSALSGLPESTLSRYINERRIPTPGSTSLHKLCMGLSIADQAYSWRTTEDFLVILRQTLPNSGIQHEEYADRLRALINELEVSRSRMASAIHYDNSFLSYVLSGKRKPADYNEFSSRCSEYLASICEIPEKQSMLCSLLGVPNSYLPDLSDEHRRSDMIYDYLLYGGTSREISPKELDLDPTTSFLVKLDVFNLNAFLNNIHFKALTSIPPQLTSPLLPRSASTQFSGLEGMKKADLTFMKNALCADNTQDIWLFSNFPMKDLASDRSFIKKWMLSLLIAVRKGITIHIIHHVQRPVNEMIMGLEGWIPLYMTGLIRPYVFEYGFSWDSYMIRVCESCSAEGACIDQDFSTATFYMTKSPEDLRALNQKCRKLFDRAVPLMEIYTSARRREFHAAKQTLWKATGDRIHLLTVPMIATMSEALLERIALRNQLTEAETQKLKKERKRQLRYLNLELTHTTLRQVLPKRNKSDFDSQPVYLDLTQSFWNKTIAYTWEEYDQHLQDTIALADSHSGMSVIVDEDYTPFRNIQIFLAKDEIAMVSKCNAPATHFIFRHPLLRDAIWNLYKKYHENGKE